MRSVNSKPIRLCQCFPTIHSTVKNDKLAAKAAASLANQAVLVPLVNPVAPAVLASPEHPDSQAVHHRFAINLRNHHAVNAHLDHQETQEPPENQDHPVNPVNLDVPETMDRQDHLVHKAPLDNLEDLDATATEETPAAPLFLLQLYPAIPDSLEIKDLPVYPESPANLDEMGKMDHQDQKAHLVHLDLLDSLAILVNQDRKDHLAFKENAVFARNIVHWTVESSSKMALEESRSFYRIISTSQFEHYFAPPFIFLLPVVAQMSSYFAGPFLFRVF